MKPLHIGIAACSAEGAALCYRTICIEAPALLGTRATSVDRRVEPPVRQVAATLVEKYNELRLDFEGHYAVTSAPTTRAWPTASRRRCRRRR